MRTRDWDTVDFYAVLGVAPTASSDEVGVAFRSLAKELHPDRVGAQASEVERFKSVTAAYEVLGDDRLRRSYDEVRFDLAARTAAAARPAAVGADRGVVSASAGPKRAVDAKLARRNGRRWLAAGIVVTLLGLLAASVVVRIQTNERSRRSGRVKTTATLVVSATARVVRFTTTTGEVVEVPEPARVNPGTQRNGQTITVLYRPDRPRDVIISESTVARDITLWIVAVKLLVGGIVFLVVGTRRLRFLSARGL